MVGNGLRFFEVGHQADPSEESDNNIDVPLDPLRVPRSNESSICINRSIHLTNTILSPSRVADLSSAASYFQCQTALSIVTLNSVVKASYPCDVPLVAHNCDPWNPFWRVTTT